ncbi:MAG TPA: hypothetical protein VK013_09975 [Myxococcaceae bacterium]|nr:hypothetical protein [Myxococcaceae bacterium]
MSLDRARRGARWSGCLVILLGLLAPVPPAWAGDCGACALSGLPSSRDLRFGLFPGELVADVSVAGSFGERREVTAEGTPVRDAGLWFENRWVALLGFSHSLGLELEVPLHAGLTSSTRTPALGQADAAQASRTGLGDTWLSLRFARPVGAWTVLATAGLSLPTGTGAALRGAEGGPDERALAVTAFGSGTWDPLLKLALTRRLGPLELVAVGQGRIRGMGAAEARAPATRLFGSVGLAHAPGTRWRYGVSADVLYSASRREIGAVAAQTQLLGTGFLQHRVNTWSTRLSVQVPLARWDSAPEVGTPGGWAHPVRIHLGWVTAFDVGV